MSLTDEQKRLRLQGVGGSEIAALVGMNPFMSPIDVWANKVEGREVPDNSAMERGRFYERPTADWWAHRTGATLREVGTIRSGRHPLVITTPDFLATLPGGEEVDLSIKVPGPRSTGWGEPGTDEVSPAYALQLQWELIALREVSAVQRGVLAAPLFGELAEFHIPIDEEIQGYLLVEAEKFWRDFVVPRKPPPVDGSDSYAAWLKSRFPTNREPLLPASVEASEWARKLREARAAKKAAEEIEAEARNNLVAFIADNAGVEGDDFRITYKATKGRESIDWNAVAFEAQLPPALISKHTKRTGYRVFRSTFNGAANE